MSMTFAKRQSGLSLIELMIAITLSLLLIAGVLQIFLSSKQTYSTNTALARVQESGRFAMEFLTQDIRNIGYKGQCLGDPVNHLSNDSAGLLTVSDPVEGWNDIGTDDSKPNHVNGTPVPGTDMLMVKLAAGTADFWAAGNAATDNRITTATPDSTGQARPIVATTRGSIILVSNAVSCDLFQNSAADNATSVAKDTGSNNKTGTWSLAYNGDVEILPLQNATYFIRANNGRPSSLVRERLGVTSNAPAWIPEELVEGIQDMQLSYGIAGANQQVTDYVDADAVTNWGNVVSVRVNLLAVSADTNVVPENQVIAFNGADVTIANRRLAQVFTTTIGIRNRLP
jgi:type IV pilus assembly protein PilW